MLFNKSLQFTTAPSKAYLWREVISLDFPAFSEKGLNRVRSFIKGKYQELLLGEHLPCPLCSYVGGVGALTPAGLEVNLAVASQ